jgi:hypothetical protein
VGGVICALVGEIVKNHISQRQKLLKLTKVKKLIMIEAVRVS